MGLRRGVDVEGRVELVRLARIVVLCVEQANRQVPLLRDADEREQVHEAILRRDRVRLRRLGMRDAVVDDERRARKHLRGARLVLLEEILLLIAGGVQRAARTAEHRVVGEQPLLRLAEETHQMQTQAVDVPQVPLLRALAPGSPVPRREGRGLAVLGGPDSGAIRLDIFQPNCLVKLLARAAAQLLDTQQRLGKGAAGLRNVEPRYGHRNILRWAEVDHGGSGIEGVPALQQPHVSLVRQDALPGERRFRARPGARLSGRQLYEPRQQPKRHRQETRAIRNCPRHRQAKLRAA
mmetsp:Transcript_92/g.223  ORF Transcript_92/g.223 Transcript_92/m.223 type:complete len:294 (+) Transcript_92:245-1126(+)